jgi:hypothetical protein
MAHRFATTRDSEWAYAVSVGGVVIDRGNKKAMVRVHKANPGSTLWGLTRTTIGEEIS